MRVGDRSLSETGYRKPRPLLALWGASALYVGPALGLSPHRNAVAVIAFGIDAPFDVAIDPAHLLRGYRSCRTALIGPNTLHHLRAGGSMAFLYLDALSRDYLSVRKRFQQSDDAGAFELDQEAAIVACLMELHARNKRWSETQSRLLQLLGLRNTAAEHIDPRIADAIDGLRFDPSRETSAAGLAREAKLSVSRFLHVFKEATGVPFRRYRTWCRLRAVVRVAATGISLTEAAHAAGFASSAHLSSSFRDMFGLAPSELRFQDIELVEVE